MSRHSIQMFTITGLIAGVFGVLMSLVESPDTRYKSITCLTILGAAASDQSKNRKN